MTITQLSLSYRHCLTFSSPCHYPRHSPLLVITRLDRVIPLPSSPILRMPRSSRSMTGRNDNYSTFLLFLPLPDIFSLPAVIPRRSPLLVITRLDRVIPLLPSQPISRMSRSSRSLTRWNNNYPLSLSSCHYLTSSLSLSLSPTFSSFCHYPT